MGLSCPSSNEGIPAGDVLEWVREHSQVPVDHRMDRSAGTCRLVLWFVRVTWCFVFVSRARLVQGDLKCPTSDLMAKPATQSRTNNKTTTGKSQALSPKT